jgi:hypothetical protein
MVYRSLRASRMNRSRSPMGQVSSQGTAHLAGERGAVQSRQSVTHVPGQMCYRCTRAIPGAVYRSLQQPSELRIAPAAPVRLFDSLAAERGR